jgi:hypothetical protein
VQFVEVVVYKEKEPKLQIDRSTQTNKVFIGHENHIDLIESLQQEICNLPDKEEIKQSLQRMKPTRVSSNTLSESKLYTS